ncbi:MAG: hypothetical protein JSS76_13695 [Bacteroidetes bacterium]|nr:hypothetical protein [Bacteroidota bacterium]
MANTLTLIEKIKQEEHSIFGFHPSKWQLKITPNNPVALRDDFIYNQRLYIFRTESINRPLIKELFQVTDDQISDNQNIYPLNGWLIMTYPIND